MTPALVDEALAAGDTKQAALLAAEIACPREYLSAMIRVFNAVQRTLPPSLNVKGI